MGQKGEPGSRGMQGNVGYPGYKGEKGREGVVGPPGPSGSEGPPGVQGKDGSKGEQGVVGTKGDMGERGLKGDMGPPGPRGETGEKGDIGQKGEAGTKGMKGNVGHTGFKGEKGQQGVVGPPGPSGPEGPPGIQGKDGSKGEQAVVGAKGDMGERGLKGDMGPPGQRGETGEKGDVGQKGEAGTKGMKGIQGNKGEKEEQGPPGMTWSCGGTGGWRRVVFLNMTDPSHDCPAGLKLTSYSRRTCGRANSTRRSCSSTTFSVGDSQYSRVCGRALAYQWGQNYAFYGYNSRSQGINGQYVDGLSLTHGAPGSRQHIWTFASGLFAGNRSSGSEWLRRFQCPCNNGNTYRSPSFVGNDYFCESVTQSTWARVFYPNATLWDGQVCEGGGTCCQFNNPPWFTKNLTGPTTDGIELRLCLTDGSSISDVALELLELYVQ